MCLAQLDCARILIRAFCLFSIVIFIVSCDEDDRPTPPRNQPYHVEIVINEGFPATRDTVLRVSITGRQIYQMKLSTDPDLAGAEWVEYDTVTVVHAPHQEGVFTIYCQLLSLSGGITEIFSEDIELDFSAMISNFSVSADSDTLIPGSILEFSLESGEDGHAEVGVGSFLRTYPLHKVGNGVFKRCVVLPTIMPEDSVKITGRFTDVVGNAAEEKVYDRTFYLKGETLNPVLVSRIEFGGPSKDKVVYHDGYCFVSNMEQINIINVTDPSSLFYSGEMRTSSWTHGMVIDQMKLYAVDNSRLLLIYDVRYPLRPVRLSATLVRSAPTDVELYLNYAFVSSTLTGVHVLDVTNSESPIIKTSLAMTCNAETICRNGNILYVGGGTIMAVVDIQEPEEPKILSELFGLDGDIVDALYSEGNLFFATSHRGVLRIDVRDPENPINMGYYPHLMGSSGLTLLTPYLFVSRRDTLSIVNITDLDNLPVVSEITDVKLTSGLNIHNNFLYAVEQDGLAVIELFMAGD